MNIGIDIDDTITNSSDIFVKYAKIYNKIHNIDHSINTDELDQSKAFGWTQKNQKEFALQYLKIILQEALPKENVIEAIKKLKELGCNIIFITARKDTEVDGMYALTKQWLDDNNIEFDKLVVNCDNKLQECIIIILNCLLMITILHVSRSMIQKKLKSYYIKLIIIKIIKI